LSLRAARLAPGENLYVLGPERKPFNRICWEKAMNRTESLETPAWVKGEKKPWSPKVKIILAFVLGLLALSPAILGIYWQLLLPR